MAHPVVDDDRRVQVGSSASLALESTAPHTPHISFSASGNLRRARYDGDGWVTQTVGVAVTCQIDTSTPSGSTDLDLYWKQLEQIEAMD